MKNKLTLVLVVSIIMMLGSCSTVTYMQPDNSDVGFPSAGTYKILGRVTIEQDQNNAGYSKLLDAAKKQYPEADDVVNIFIDRKITTKTMLFMLPVSTYTYILSGIAIDYIN